MTNIELDFSNCKYISSIHKVLKDAFDFPEYYGENLDALWDCLEYYCDYDLQVNIRGISMMPRELHDYMLKIQEVFKEVHKTTPNISFSVLS